MEAGQGDTPLPGSGPGLHGVLRVHVEDCVFTVEKSLLARESEYFRALFRSGMRECSGEELRLRGAVRARGFAAAMAVCRGERPGVDGDADALVEAAECAAFLQVEALTRHLADILDTDNCFVLYHAATVLGLQALLDAAATFIRDSDRDLQEAAGALPGEMLRRVASLSPASFVALGTHTPSSEALRDRFRTVWHLDERRGAWAHLTDLPVDASTAMAGVAVLENRLYVVGGVVGASRATVDRSFCYDADGDTWSAFEGPRQPRYDFALIGHEGRLFAVGGEHADVAMSTAEVCHVSERRWSFVRPAPRPVSGAASCVARGRIFVCFWRPPEGTDIYEYVPARDEWLLTTTMIRAQSYGHRMVARGERLYVVRNGPHDDFLHCHIECYHIATGQWTSLPGRYVNSRGALFTAVVRGDSALTVNRSLTLEYAVGEDAWTPRRQMAGFPKSGSLWTCLLRLPGPGHGAGAGVGAGAGDEAPGRSKNDGEANRPQ